MLDSTRLRKFAFRGLRSCVLATLALPLIAQEPTFVRDVRLEPGEDASAHSLLLEGGRIVGVLGVDAPAPPGARIVEANGQLCLPSFIDAYATTGIVVPEPEKDQDRPVDDGSDVRVEMREANRKGIQPTFRAATALELAKPAEAWRAAGFALAVLSPGGELLAGDGCLATTRDAASRDVVVEPSVWGHAAFRASGPGYPSTLMGYTSQLRQFFLDAQRHALLVERQRAGREGERPRWDPELAAGSLFLGGARRLVCEADTSRDIERWLRIADEFGLSIAISGGSEAWRVADELARRRIPVLLTLDWGEEVEDPDADSKADEKDDAEDEPVNADEGGGEGEEIEPDEPEEPPARGRGGRGRGRGAKGKSKQLDEKWVYQEPLEVRRERRRMWEEQRDCALRLSEAGVTFAFGTGGAKPDELLGRARTLVEAGLPRERVLAALTTTAAELLGREQRTGRVARGFDAHLALWTGDPLVSKDAKASWIFVEGWPIDLEIEPETKQDETDDEGDDR